MAERVAKGEVYGVEVHDFHGGYHTYLNAWLFKVFGFDMAVLRYPFFVISSIQAALAAYLLRRSGFWISFLGGLSMTTLTFMLFPNPSPNWFALFFAVVIVFILTEWEWKPSTLLIAGVVWGLAFMFRHPSAAFLLLGVVAYAIHRQQIINDSDNERKYSIHHLVLFGMAMFILAYSYIVFEWFGFLLFGLPALLITGLMASRRYSQWRQLFLDGFWFGTGAAVAIFPMVIFQLLHGDVLLWMKNSFFAGLSMPDMEFFTSYSYLGFFIDTTISIPIPMSLTLALYYLVRCLVPVLLVGIVAYLWLKDKDSNLPPVVLMAPFYALVSFYFQIEFYFFVGFPLLLLAFLILIGKTGRILNIVIIAGLIHLQVSALFWNAPSVSAIRFPDLYVNSDLSRASLVITGEVKERYQTTLKIIESHTEVGDVIYAFPFSPEYYFLSERVNYSDEIGTSFAVTSDEDFQNLLNDLDEVQPAMMIFASDNFYASEYDWLLLEKLLSDPNYELVANERLTYFFARTDR
tara:strand:- start:37343 stop:38899 length:1557 start_codon:yes stop_codon:yes gene_type:complete